jgi:malate dehydrogenase (oxaloacetate-decarboxylating)
VEGGVATQEGIPREDEELDRWIEGQMWAAEYRPLKLVRK